MPSAWWQRPYGGFPESAFPAPLLNGAAMRTRLDLTKPSHCELDGYQGKS